MENNQQPNAPQNISLASASYDNTKQTPLKMFRKLSKKQLIFLLAGVFILIVLVVVLIRNGNSNTGTKGQEMAEQIAIYQIQQQIYAKDESVYDVEIVANDGKGRYIVTATTKPGAFETWWAVYIEISEDMERYRAVANSHGDGMTVEDWVTKYKTDQNYSWGQSSMT